MGIYRYTLRMDTKVIDGLEIGRMAFAYKEHFWSRDAAYLRRQGVTEAAAERARYAHPTLRYVIVGEWKYIDGKEDIAVVDIGTTRCCWSDGGHLGDVVGVLRREGRRIVFIPATPKAIAA